MRPDRTRQHGFGVIAAVVVLVIFAGLSAFIVSMSTSQQLGSALDVQGSRASLAARAGLEWGKYQTVSSSCAASTDLTIDSYSVKVECTEQSTGAAVEAGLGSIYAITATACNNATCPNPSPNALYVERKVSALIER